MTMTLQGLIDRTEQRRQRAADTLRHIRQQLEEAGGRDATPEEAREIREASIARSEADRQLDMLRAEQRADDELTALSRQVTRTDTGVRNEAYARGVSPEQVRAELAARGERFEPPRTPVDDDHTGIADRWVRRHDGRPAVVERTQRFADQPVVAEYANQRAAAERPVIDAHGSIGNLVRAMSTTGGAAVVPTAWAGSIIDRARNNAAVLQAGAQIVPMDTKTLQIGRLTTDPTAGFRAEGSTITASDPVFDNVTLTAKTLSCLVVGSLEFFMDALNADQVVEEAVGRAMGLEIDKQALFGGLTAGAETGATGFNTTFPNPPNPTGVLQALTAAGFGVLGNQANGTTQTGSTPWTEIIQTVLQPTLYNETPNALIWAARMAQRYADLYDSTNQPLRRPPALDNVQTFVSNQIPVNMTQGTSTTNQTDVFAGDWTKLLIGQRLDFQIQVLTERYAELGQIGILATWRGDVALARPRAFSVWRYLKNT